MLKSAIFLYHCPSSRDRKLLFDNYGSVFPDFPTFVHVYSFITAQPYTAMVILLNQGHRGILESVFWYRPPALSRDGGSPPRMCHPCVWQHAERRTDTGKLNNIALLSCCSNDEER